MDWEQIGYLKASNNRLLVMRQLESGNRTPKEIQASTALHFSQVSKILKDLVLKELVDCQSNMLRKGKIYSISTKGKQIIDFIDGVEKQ